MMCIFLYSYFLDTNDTDKVVSVPIFHFYPAEGKVDIIIIDVESLMDMLF